MTHLERAMAYVDGGEPERHFDGVGPDGYRFSARADLYVIRAAWEAGCDLEAEADGFGRGLGTCGGDWSGIRDSSDVAVVAMTAKAMRYLRAAARRQAEYLQRAEG